MSAEVPALRVEGLTKSYGGAPVLRNASLDVPAGGCTAVVGPSGSGKSTLLRVVAGLESADAGRVTIGGEVTDAPRSLVPPERRGAGFLFQDLALWPHLSLRGNLDFVLEARGVARAARRAEADAAARAVELPLALLERRPSDVSGGERQRAALARVLVQAPRILLLDEPLSHLDPTLRDALVLLLRRLRRERGLASLLVTHDRSEAFALAQRVVVLRDGRVEQEGTPADVYERPRTAFVAAFVGRANLLPVDRRGDRLVAAHGEWAAAGAPSGPLLAVVRPEQFRRVADGASGARGVVTDAYPCGDHWMAAARLEGSDPVHVRFASATPPELGASCTLAVDAPPVFVPRETEGGS